MHWRRLRPGEYDLERFVGTIAFPVFIAATAIAVYILPVFGGPACRFRALFGAPCPTCGASRALLRMLQGHGLEAFLLQPLVVLLGALFAFAAVYSWIVVLFRLPRLRGLPRISFRTAAIVAVFAILANWAWVMARHARPHADPETAARAEHLTQEHTARPARNPRTLTRAAARIRGFDPVRAGDVASALAYAKVYEGLLHYDYLARPYRLVPLLAEAMPDVSEDGRTYTFRIRRGIRFQDDPCFPDGKGRELTAEDFVYSIKRVADAKNASPGYWAFRDRIVGLDDFRRASSGPDPTDYGRDVAGLTAPDRYTLRLELTAPYPQLLHTLTLHYASAVPREAVEHYGEAFANHPVGTGPFVLESWRRNYRMSFVRNSAWAESGRVDRFPAGDGEEPHPATGRPLPLLDRIVEYVVADPATQWQMFLLGQLHFSGVAREQWHAVLDSSGHLSPELARRGIRLESAPALDVFYIGFNMDDPVVGTNRPLRQAISAAFNRGEWEQFHGGRVTAAAGPVPPGAEDYVPLEPRFPHDLDRARALLADAGYPGGIDPETGRRLQLSLDVADADNPELRQSTELFIQFMDRIGLVVEPRFSNRPTFFERVSRRQAQLFRLSWIADYPDAQNFLQLFYSPNASPGSNRANYHHPEYDRLYERVAVMPPGPERRALIRHMVARVQEDCPWIFMHHRRSMSLVHGDVLHYRLHDFPYGMDKYLDVR